MKKSKTVNMNYAWAEVAISELGRLGVTTFFVAPGSRSSPLALAAAEFAPEMIVHIDERGLGFAALGHARATGKPAVVITTSGSAVANLWPAVCEASTDHVPMLILSADRPPELRDTGANQTMDQVKLFSGYVRWMVDLPCPDANIPASYLVSTLDEAYARATRSPAGPVHLNQMFREPLAPIAVRDHAAEWQATLGAWWSSENPWTRHAVASWQVESGDALEAITAARKGLIVAGELRDKSDQRAVVKLAAQLGWPILPDIRSGLRFQSIHPHVITMADQIMLSDKAVNGLRPDVVLHCGGRITSKRVQQFLTSAQCRYVMVHKEPVRIDPDRLVTDRYLVPPSRFARLFSAKSKTRTPPSWLKVWTKVNKAVSDAWLRDLKQAASITEPGIAADVSRLLPKNHGLFMASSMPIRDMEMYGLGNGHPIDLVSNRGVSGIDGNLATACGYAAGLARPVTLVIGDLALLHDINSLMLAAKSVQPVTIVIVNNDGGAIFSFLPVAGVPLHFETCFGTPHGMTFRSAAELFGLPYEQPKTAREFHDCYTKQIRSGISGIIEVVTERRNNLLEHKRVQAMLKDAADHAC